MSEPTTEIVDRLNRPFLRGALTAKEAAWQIVDSLRLKPCQKTGSVNPVFLAEIISGVSPEVASEIRNISELPDEEVYLRNVVCDSPGPRIVRVSVDPDHHPARILLHLSDGTTSEITPDFPTES